MRKKYYVDKIKVLSSLKGTKLLVVDVVYKDCTTKQCNVYELQWYALI